MKLRKIIQEIKLVGNIPKNDDELKDFLNTHKEAILSRLRQEYDGEDENGMFQEMENEQFMDYKDFDLDPEDTFPQICYNGGGSGFSFSLNPKFETYYRVKAMAIGQVTIYWFNW